MEKGFHRGWKLKSGQGLGFHSKWKPEIEVVQSAEALAGRAAASGNDAVDLGLADARRCDWHGCLRPQMWTGQGTFEMGARRWIGASRKTPVMLWDLLPEASYLLPKLRWLWMWCSGDGWHRWR